MFKYGLGSSIIISINFHIWVCIFNYVIVVKSDEKSFSKYFRCSSVFENLSLVFSMTISNSFYEQLESKNWPGNEMSKYLTYLAV